MTRRVRAEVPISSVREMVIGKLAQTKDGIVNAGRDRGYLKKAKRAKVGTVSKENIIKEKRARTTRAVRTDPDVSSTEKETAVAKKTKGSYQKGGLVSVSPPRSLRR